MRGWGGQAPRAEQEPGAGARAALLKAGRSGEAGHSEIGLHPHRAVPVGSILTSPSPVGSLHTRVVGRPPRAARADAVSWGEEGGEEASLHIQGGDLSSAPH